MSIVAELRVCGRLIFDINGGVMLYHKRAGVSVIPSSTYGHVRSAVPDSRTHTIVCSHASSMDNRWVRLSLPMSPAQDPAVYHTSPANSK